MGEKYIVDMLVLNLVNYHKFGDKHFQDNAGFWLVKLQKLKGFSTTDETADYVNTLGGV